MCNCWWELPYTLGTSALIQSPQPGHSRFTALLHLLYHYPCCYRQPAAHTIIIIIYHTIHWRTCVTIGENRWAHLHWFDDDYSFHSAGSLLHLLRWNKLLPPSVMVFIMRHAIICSEYTAHLCWCIVAFEPYLLLWKLSALFFRTTHTTVHCHLYILLLHLWGD